MESGFEVQHYTNVQCVCHLHLEAEFIMVTEGTLHVIGTRSEVVLHRGEALYLMPLEIHGFRTENTSQCTIVIFHTDLVPEFAAAQPSAHPFTLSSSVSEQLQALNPTAIYDRLHAAAVLYPLCCEITDRCSAVSGNPEEEKAIKRVERYIWDHINAPLSLKSVAAATGFNPSYLSRMFHQSKGIGFLEYVNMLRCYQAVRLLSKKTQSVSEIAYQVGFESIRTFNRAFLRCYGITPSQMVKRNAASIPRA